ncbi:hypothetical protein [Vannielia sp.]|uniref:hypothetical protein n=1 Tax=Vannielia sp. TaxID=2813045 RepID=UPI00260DF9BA|nr:hypothetical protein [Vannielia sp.]MDF1872963.1 hypothetical protein [Vannielia sp.]
MATDVVDAMKEFNSLAPVDEEAAGEGARGSSRLAPRISVGSASLSVDGAATASLRIVAAVTDSADDSL